MTTLRNKLNPLTWSTPIVDKWGLPTIEFQRKWAQQQATNSTIIDLSNAAGVSAVLDLIGKTPGDLLIRGASAWTVAVMSGDVTISTAGVTTIGNAKVTYAKIQNVTDNRLLGRSSGSAGPMIEIAVGTGLSLSSGTLTCTVTSGVGTTGTPASGNLAKFSGAATITNGDLSGDVTTSGTLVTTINGNLKTAAITFIIDGGGGSAITTGLKGYLQIPFACTIQEATQLADQSGSIVTNIWKCTYAQFDAGGTHPVVGDKITASAPPTIATATKSDDSTLTGWTTSISAGDILAFNVDSITTVTRVTLTLKVLKT